MQKPVIKMIKTNATHRSLVRSIIKRKFTDYHRSRIIMLFGHIKSVAAWLGLEKNIRENGKIAKQNIDSSINKLKYYQFKIEIGKQTRSISIWKL